MTGKFAKLKCQPICMFGINPIVKSGNHGSGYFSRYFLRGDGVEIIKMSDLKTFSLFGQLPQEIRAMIWEQVVRPARPGAHLFGIYDESRASAICPGHSMVTPSHSTGGSHSTPQTLCLLDAQQPLGVPHRPRPLVSMQGVAGCDEESVLRCRVGAASAILCRPAIHRALRAACQPPPCSTPPGIPGCKDVQRAAWPVSNEPV
ncbi:hypothetical protein B0T14DRAFT_512994 [Immersiella caudata]|uniref:Uncharacterized protein n=1 Tax=Immersiella caudata TaxID=314043 RepID=A0AA39X638_9PEZI|nr:hypothetical protein B0T14DRAFT_512994 [Immersiella caudata]